MFKHTASGGDILTVFKSELRIHILIAERSYQTLYNQHLSALGNRNIETYSPIEAIADFSLFLNSTAMINKILGFSKQYNNTRSEKLRTAIQIDMKKIYFLGKVDLRNSMEHMDERIDTLSDKNLSEIIIWDFTKEKSKSQNTLRKFDPKSFTIECLGRDLNLCTLDIKKCYSEIQYLKNLIQ